MEGPINWLGESYLKGLRRQYGARNVLLGWPANAQGSPVAENHSQIIGVYVKD